MKKLSSTLFLLALFLSLGSCNNKEQKEEAAPTEKELISDSHFVKIGKQL